MLANLSALADADRVPMGLDTARWLKDDLLQHPVEIKNGEIDLSKLNNRRQNLVANKLDLVV